MDSPSTRDRANAYIGRALPRLGIKRFLAGRGRYVTDQVLPRMLHAAFIRSPHAHARIVSIDTSAAAAMPGVHRVVTGGDLSSVCKPWTGTLAHFAGMKSPPQLPLPLERVLWAGQPVIAIAAESRAQAEDAAEAVVIEYEALPAVTDAMSGCSPRAQPIHPEFDDNICFRTVLDTGGIDACLQRAAHVVEEKFYFGRHTAVTLEPRAIIADYAASEEQLTVYHAAQTPYQFQDLYARHFSIPEARVRVIAPDIGGSFGMKLHVYHEEMAVVSLSILLGRPVKFVADRTECFVSDIHAREHCINARIALDEKGTILAMDVQDVAGIGAFSSYPRTSAVEGNQVVRLIGAPYRLRDYRAALSIVFQNKVQTSQYRAVGHPIACAVTERLVDLAAARLGIDPFTLRARNVIRDDAYPCETLTGYQLEQLSHEACLAKLRAMMNYDELRLEQQHLRGRGIYRGIGVAAFVEITNPGPLFYGVGGARISAQDGAILKLTPSGDVHCLTSVTEQGQGTEAMIGQIVADQLGVAHERIKVITGDTDVTPHGGATWASRGAGIGGETALQVARRLKTNILSLAAAVLQCDSSTLNIEDGQIVTSGTRARHMSLADLAGLAYFRSDRLPEGADAQLSVAHHFSPKGYPFAFTNGAQACWVEVDIDTGLVKVLKHWIVEDCGRIINPLLVDEQLRGGVVQGLGAAFFEECLYDEDGQLTNGSLVDYLVPMAGEMPDIEIGHVETPTAQTELGAKGCGEAGTAGASAAALNAVNDAIAPFGAALAQLPMTPLRILSALGCIPDSNASTRRAVPEHVE